MIADKSTTNLIFFYFFFTSRTTWAASGKRTIARAVFRTEAAAGSGQGLQLRNRTIVPRIPSSRGPAPPWQHLLSGTGRTIARNPDSCNTCWTPTTRTIIRFLGRTAAGQPPDTEQLFGLAARPGGASTRKANNGWFLRVW